MNRFETIVMIIVLLMFSFAPMLVAQDVDPEAPVVVVAPAEKADVVPAEKADDWEIGKDLDGETITKILTNLAEAAQQKGSFWRNPSLWEAVWLIILVVLGFLAAKFGWKKKKWGKIIQAVEKAVNTTYVEFVREAKLKQGSGGKLSKDDMKKALEDAWDMTKADLLAQGIDLSKWIAKEYFPVVVDKILKAVKK